MKFKIFFFEDQENVYFSLHFYDGQVFYGGGNISAVTVLSNVQDKSW